MGKRMDEVLQKLIDVNNSVTFIGALLETNLEKGEAAMEKNDVITALHYYAECKKLIDETDKLKKQAEVLQMEFMSASLLDLLDEGEGA